MIVNTSMVLFFGKYQEHCGVEKKVFIWMSGETRTQSVIKSDSWWYQIKWLNENATEKFEKKNIRGKIARRLV